MNLWDILLKTNFIPLAIHWMNEFLSNDHQYLLIQLGEELMQNFVTDGNRQYLKTLWSYSDQNKKETTRYCVLSNVIN